MDTNTKVVSIQNDNLNYKNKVKFLMEKFNLETEFSEWMTAKGNIKNELWTVKEFYGITDLTDLEMIKKLKLDEEDAALLFEELDKLGIAYDSSEFTIETEDALKTARHRVIPMKPKWKSAKDGGNGIANKEVSNDKDRGTEGLDK